MISPTLIIIDMQRGMSTSAAGERNNVGAEQAIALLLAAWRQARAPVVHVRHSGLERWLHARGMNAVAIAGVSTNNSVEATARLQGEYATVVTANELLSAPIEEKA